MRSRTQGSLQHGLQLGVEARDDRRPACWTARKSRSTAALLKPFMAQLVHASACPAATDGGLAPSCTSARTLPSLHELAERRAPSRPSSARGRRSRRPPPARRRLYGTWRSFTPYCLLDQLHRHDARRCRSRRSHRRAFPLLLLRLRHHLGERLPRLRRMRGDHVGNGADQHHRLERGRACRTSACSSDGLTAWVS